MFHLSFYEALSYHGQEAFQYIGFLKPVTHRDPAVIVIWRRPDHNPLDQTLPYCLVITSNLKCILIANKAKVHVSIDKFILLWTSFSIFLSASELRWIFTSFLSFSLVWKLFQSVSELRREGNITREKSGLYAESLKTLIQAIQYGFGLQQYCYTGKTYSNE